MINCDKLLQILNAKRDVSAFKSQFRELLGLTESHTGELKLDRNNREFEAKEVSFGELAHAFLGRNMRERLRMMPNIREADGTVVGPSYFSNISAFSDAVGGLLDALVLEAWQNPAWIMEDVFEFKETRVNGGRMISVEQDGGVNDATLLPNEPYPMVGLKERWVEVPDNERFGNAVQLSEQDFLYDRTDKIQSAASATGDAVARKREIRAADCALGITNNYSSDGNTSNTYLTSAGNIPNNYVNSATNELLDWKDIDQAMQTLSANTNPYSGFEINFEPPFDLLVMPQNYLNASTMVRATEVQTRTQTSTEIRKYENPIVKINLIRASYVWYNRLINASVSTTNAPARWHFGNLKRAFKYRVLIPFETRDLPISAEEARQDIVMIKLAREHGVPFVADPRYAYQGTKE